MGEVKEVLIIIPSLRLNTGKTVGSGRSQYHYVNHLLNKKCQKNCHLIIADQGTTLMKSISKITYQGTIYGFEFFRSSIEVQNAQYWDTGHDLKQVSSAALKTNTAIKARMHLYY